MILLFILSQTTCKESKEFDIKSLSIPIELLLNVTNSSYSKTDFLNFVNSLAKGETNPIPSLLSSELLYKLMNVSYIFENEIDLTKYLGFRFPKMLLEVPFHSFIQ